MTSKKSCCDDVRAVQPPRCPQVPRSGSRVTSYLHTHASEAAPTPRGNRSPSRRFFKAVTRWPPCTRVVLSRGPVPPHRSKPGLPCQAQAPGRQLCAPAPSPLARLHSNTPSFLGFESAPPSHSHAWYPHRLMPASPAPCEASRMLARSN